MSSGLYKPAGFHWDVADRVVRPDGLPSCRWCKGPVRAPRRTFCGRGKAPLCVACGFVEVVLVRAPGSKPDAPSVRSAACPRCHRPLRANGDDVDPCIHSWKLHTDLYYATDLVRDRDRGVCSSCGIDAGSLLAEAYREMRSAPLSPRYLHGAAYWEHYAPATTARALASGITSRDFAAAFQLLWIAVHIVPIADGGTYELTNLRTLCLGCHRAAAAGLAGKMPSPARAGGDGR